MRIKSIKLAWFRGAADGVTLDTESKSIVVYGENGSGKSSFVDAVEHVLNDGRVGHLAHEHRLGDRHWRVWHHPARQASAVLLHGRSGQRAGAGEGAWQGRAHCDQSAAYGLVILDELGYLPFSQAGGALLFHLLSRLYEHTSVMITTNLDFAVSVRLRPS